MPVYMSVTDKCVNADMKGFWNSCGRIVVVICNDVADDITTTCDGADSYAAVKTAGRYK